MIVLDLVGAAFFIGFVSGGIYATYIARREIRRYVK